MAKSIFKVYITERTHVATLDTMAEAIKEKQRLEKGLDLKDWQHIIVEEN